MTQASHSTLNTYLLGVISFFMTGILGLLTWCLVTVVDIGKNMAAQGKDVTLHTEQIASVQKDVADSKLDIQKQVQVLEAKFDRKVDALTLKIDTTKDQLIEGQTKIELALRDMPRSKSR